MEDDTGWLAALEKLEQEGYLSTEVWFNGELYHLPKGEGRQDAIDRLLDAVAATYTID